jgi:hypothetical protein
MSDKSKRKKIEALALDPRTDPATRAAAAAKAKELRTIHKLIVQVARPGSGKYPHGRVEETWWFEENDVVWLCDERGVRTGDNRAVPANVDAKVIAMLLLKEKTALRNYGWDRPLHYPTLKY